MNTIKRGMPVKGNGDDGDSLLWAGLLTAVGDPQFIPAIKNCQSADGRLWRHPSRVRIDTENTFSRDMALGFILYFQATQDHAMADAWINYIRGTGYLFPPKQSTDNRHIVTPALWWLMSYAGMNVPTWWRITRWLYRPYNYLETLVTPRGFQSHLKAVAALIMSIHDGKRNKRLGQLLFKREPNNAFFAWLAGDNHKAVRLKVALAWRSKNYSGDGSQWCWERTDSENAWKDSMGWDFKFIDYLMTLSL